ncbi:hypothetical protein BG011_007995 [Mortierella polycephala]|uniref:BAG domain-containing protein n=1 Tax=Mortierella polycephala TaxID=41804 RepID=A0A9P6PQS7_9FUNG|nr:hypothetical protein BG011_007995 [Mortierella polycephala]
MYSIFSDPRLTQGTRRRQDRQDFFPGFSDSLFFDPLSYHQSNANDNDDDDGGEEYPFFANQPQKHRQGRQPRHQQQRQQHQSQPQHQYEQQPQQPQQQHEEEPDEMEERQPMAEQQRHESAQGRHQRQQRKQHQQHQQHQQPQTHIPQTQAGDGSKRRNRRQRRREKKGFGVNETPATQVPLTQARGQQPHEDYMQSLVEGAFGDKVSLSDASPVTKSPTSSVPISSQRSYAPKYEDRSKEDMDQDEKDVEDEEDEEAEKEDEDIGDDFAEDVEEDQMAPDLEQQQKSWAELSKIDSDLDKLSEELNQIVTGAISNKRTILMTEENLVKVMLRVDSVESGGSDAIRKQRKALIAKTERLLAKVDEFKHRTKISAYYPRN